MRSRLSAVRNRLRRPPSLVATPAQANDVYIVEFPKSGITWISTVIANLALDASGVKDFDVTFTNLRTIVPDIHLGTEIGPTPYTVPPLRFIKSHSGFNPRYKLAIYLARHPLAVFNSYYRYRRRLGHTGLSFSAFLRDDTFGVETWCRHVDGWLTRAPQGGILHLVRYEDMEIDPIAAVGAICANFGWKVSPEKISWAVEKASVGAMKESEALFNSHDPRYEAGFVKGERTAVSSADREYINDTCKSQLQLLGYDVPDGV